MALLVSVRAPAYPEWGVCCWQAIRGVCESSRGSLVAMASAGCGVAMQLAEVLERLSWSSGGGSGGLEAEAMAAYQHHATLAASHRAQQWSTQLMQVHTRDQRGGEGRPLTLVFVGRWWGVAGCLRGPGSWAVCC